MDSNLKDVLEVVFSGVGAVSTAAAVIVALCQANRGEQLNRQIVRMMVAHDIKDDFQEQMTKAWNVRGDLNDLANHNGRKLIELQSEIDKQCSSIVAALKGILGRFNRKSAIESFEITEGVLYGVGYFSEVIVKAKLNCTPSNWDFDDSDVDDARLDLVHNWFTHIIDVHNVYGDELGENLTEIVLSQSAFPGRYGDDLIGVDMNDYEIAKTVRDAFDIDISNYGVAFKRWLQLRVLYEFNALVLLSSSRITNWSFDVKHASNVERATLFNILLGQLLTKALEYAKEDFDVVFEDYSDNEK